MSLVTETVRENARARMEREKRPAMNTVRGGFCFRKYHSDDMTVTDDVASNCLCCLHVTLAKTRSR